MNLQKRDCPLEIELVPRGAGWTHVYLTTGGKRIKFVITNVMGEQFSDLVRILYLFTPDQNDSDRICNLVEYTEGDFTFQPGEAPEGSTNDPQSASTVHFIEIPHTAEFIWNEEPSFSRWILEREPNLDTDFAVKLHIEIQRYEDGEATYDFEFRYKDLCYAVAKACTKVLKEYGFWGYHVSTYHEEFCIHHLLFLKAVVLDCLDVREWTQHLSGHGEVTRIEDEIELLLFDM
jgi:hypothetical protein